MDNVELKNHISKIVIQFALAIAAASFFEVKRKKRFSEKRDLKGNAQKSYLLKVGS